MANNKHASKARQKGLQLKKQKERRGLNGALKKTAESYKPTEAFDEAALIPSIETHGYEFLHPDDEIILEEDLKKHTGCCYSGGQNLGEILAIKLGG